MEPYFPAPPPRLREPRRLLRFSLRTLLSLILVLSCTLGWLGVQWKWIRDRRDALESLTASGYYERVPSWVKSPFPANLDYRPAPSPLRLFGERGIANIYVLADFPQAEQLAGTLGTLFPEAHVGVLGNRNEPLVPEARVLGARSQPLPAFREGEP